MLLGQQALCALLACLPDQRVAIALHPLWPLLVSECRDSGLRLVFFSVCVCGGVALPPLWPLSVSLYLVEARQARACWLVDLYIEVRLLCFFYVCLCVVALTPCMWPLSVSVPLVEARQARAAHTFS